MMHNTIKAPTEINPADFPLKEARKLVKDLWTPNEPLYWADFFVSNIIGWAAIAVASTSAFLSAAQIIALVVATLAIYRAVIFIHELAHLPKGSFGLFRMVWNATCGMPLMVPSYSYTGVHIDHHKPKVYGTEEDGEYVAFATGKPWRILGFLAEAFIIPVLLAARFLLLAPITFIHKGFRDYIWERASSLMIDFHYKRPAPVKGEASVWMMQDVLTCLYAYTITSLVIFDVLPLAFIGVWYTVTFSVFLLNGLRTLAAHAYRNPGEKRLTQQEEFLDSVNVPGNRYITPLWAPVGLRFHATHHLFPGMPYHQLEKAHNRLVAELPDNSLYLAASRKNLWTAVAQLWREAKAAERS